MSDFTPDYQTPQRMEAKLRAIPLPDLEGKRVLDVGTDHGFWAMLASDRGAMAVLGLDRGRPVKGRGFVDLVEQNRARKYPKCWFERINLGAQWHEFGAHDVVFLFSLYHHIYQAAGGDHTPIWAWLARHCTRDGEVLWENPIDCTDSVVRRNVEAQHHAGYNLGAILAAAAAAGFSGEYIGPAIHEPTREVWRFRRTNQEARTFCAGEIHPGAGGASKAFAHAEGNRIREVREILGWSPYPGSLNVKLAHDFDWDRGYYRARVSDLVDRKAGLNSAWAPQWARFYPCRVAAQDGNSDSISCVAFRFEKDRTRYPANFVELLAPGRLRDDLTAPEVTLSWQ